MNGLWSRFVLCATAIAALTGLASCGGSDNNMPAPTRFKMSILVSDGAIAAPHTDPNLKNGWGVAFNPNGFAWVANNGTQTAALFDGNGVVQSLVVSIPQTANGPANPTGSSITAWAPAVDMTHA